MGLFARRKSQAMCTARSTPRDSVSLFADRVLDVGLALVEARFIIEVGGYSYNPLRPSKLSRATRDVSNVCSGELPCDVLHKQSSSGREPIAVLRHIHRVDRARAIAVEVIGNATGPGLDELKPVDHGCVVGIGVVRFENSHYMIGHVSCVENELLRVFGVFSRRLEGNLLLLFTKTMGIVVVAALAASAEAVSEVAINETRATSSRVSLGSASGRFSAERCSMATFWPST